MRDSLIFTAGTFDDSCPSETSSFINNSCESSEFFSKLIFAISSENYITLCLLVKKKLYKFFVLLSKKNTLKIIGIFITDLITETISCVSIGNLLFVVLNLSKNSSNNTFDLKKYIVMNQCIPVLKKIIKQLLFNYILQTYLFNENNIFMIVLISILSSIKTYISDLIICLRVHFI